MSGFEKEKAVALKYNPEKDDAPVIIASGAGFQAKKIIEIAEESGIPIFRDDSTASILSALEMGREIPDELFEVVALFYMEVLKISRQVSKEQSTKEDNS